MLDEAFCHFRGVRSILLLLFFLNDILHMSFLAGTQVFKAYPAYTTTEI